MSYYLTVAHLKFFNFTFFDAVCVFSALIAKMTI